MPTAGHREVVFSNLTLPAHIADDAFRPQSFNRGLPGCATMARPPVVAGEGPGVWNAPPAAGISHDGPPRRRCRARRGTGDHLVFSDGVASVSVFIENRCPDAPNRWAKNRLARGRGSSSAFSTVRDGHKYALGEVPPATVRIHRRPGAPGRGPGAGARPRNKAVPVRLTVVHRQDCELCDQMVADCGAGPGVRHCHPWKCWTWTPTRNSAPPRITGAGAAAGWHRGMPPAPRCA